MATNSTIRLAGINSGLDTEAMIKGMMSSYQNKIDTQNKKLQKLQWQQEQYRDITSKLKTFKSKYFDILKRDTYLMSPTQFSKYKAVTSTKSGKESGLKVTASSGAVSGSHKIKVNQLATAATTKSAQVAPSNFKLDVERAMADSTVDENGKYNFSLDVKVGNVAKTVEFSGSNKDELLSSLNDQLAEQFGTTSSGAAFISASVKNGEFAFETAGNAMATVTERTGNFGMGKPSTRVAIDPAAALTGKSSISVSVPNYYSGEMVTKNIEFDTVSSTYFDSSDATIKQQFNDLKLAAFAKSSGMNYDPNDEAIKKMVEDQMKDNEKNGYAFKYTSLDAAHDYNSQSLTSALNSAYGMEQGISFSIDGSSMTAKYMQNGSAAEFTMTSTCDATFGLKKGSATSYIQESTKLADLGISPDAHFDDGDFYTMSINGKEIKVGADATVADLMSAVNKSGAGVTMTYSKLEGCFNIVANDKGTGGNIKIDESGALAQALKLTSGTGANHTSGKNALIEFDGVQIEHNDNVYEVDNVKYDFAEVDPTEGETIDVHVSKDNESIKKTIMDFVNDYNTMVDEIMGYVKTARPKNSETKSYYEPLTDEEKEEMSDKEIEKWEEQAKKGLLYNDSTVSTIMSRMRMAMYTSVETENGGKFGLYNMGIKGASYLNSPLEDVKLGKLTVDEDALDKALEQYSDEIVKLFTDSENGVMAKVNKVIDNAVKETGDSKTQGSLIRKAGTEKGSSAKTNAIYKEMERINKRLERLQETYEKKEEYWWKVFTNLEKMQAQFDSQQNYMAQFTANGGYLS